MLANIIAALCTLVALAAGGFALWAEIGPEKKDSDNKDKKDS